MNKEVSIVPSGESPNYRRLAQLHWGLSDEQMKGMHVHHWPPKAQGGRSIPEHLYVCSPTMHHYGWHNGTIGYSMKAVMAGIIGGGRHSEKQKAHRSRMGHELKLRPEKKEWCSAGGSANTAAQRESRTRLAREMAKNKCKKVLCVELNEVFDSLTKASQATGVAISNISKCCSGERKVAGGFHWRLV